MQLFDVQDSSLIAGTISEEEGQFILECPMGTYTLRIDFMGYKSEESSTITLSNENPSLPPIALTPVAGLSGTPRSLIYLKT